MILIHTAMLIPRRVTTSDSINIIGITLTFIISILTMAFTIAMWRLTIATLRLHREQHQQRRGELIRQSANQAMRAK
ncbi:hypothetical protein AOQ84DRAFT_355761 [Glonium stellatum]|uniref:Uncharacterized protein n=1 Tax=Glonium stellatum TaxID=574774 RepID=A0A8E2EWZ0_9PEZI|nr:hypothetical protein AOQ84DRAFT_355761 [Glonium stellatum]